MANWKHKIEIKSLFEDDTTPELIVKLCNSLAAQLNPILKKYETSNEEYADSVYWDLELCVDNFDHLKRLADGTIKEEDWDDYSFKGDFEEMFNDYLEELYDLGDMYIEPNTKFLWVG